MENSKWNPSQEEEKGVKSKKPGCQYFFQEFRVFSESLKREGWFCLLCEPNVIRKQVIFNLGIFYKMCG
jgi:hypothetical protein